MAVGMVMMMYKEAPEVVGLGSLIRTVPTVDIYIFLRDVLSSVLFFDI